MLNVGEPLDPRGDVHDTWMGESLDIPLKGSHKIVSCGEALIGRGVTILW